MFSYRPEGVPKATLELNASDGSIREIAGKNNDPMSKELKDEVLRALAPVQKQIHDKYLNRPPTSTGDPVLDAEIDGIINQMEW